jgi:hypothetical protein
MRRISAVCVVTVLAALNAACDGDAGFSPPDEEAGGIYTGTLNADVGGVPTAFPLFGAITPNNHLNMTGADVHIAGPVTTSQVKFQADLTAFVGLSGGFYGMGGLDPVIMDGLATGGATIAGDWAAPGVLGTFAFTYEGLSTEFASLDLTAGAWTYNGAFNVTLNIDAAGVVSGTDSNGCSFTGQIDVLDQFLNVYFASMVVSGCGVNDGDYSGSVFLASVGGLILDQMTLGVSNDLSAYSVVLDKM